MKNIINNNFKMLKYLNYFSKLYLPISIILEILTFIKYLGNLLFFKIVIDYFLYYNAQLKDFLFYLLLYYVGIFVVYSFDYYLYTYLHDVEKINISKKTQEYTYNKIINIDVSAYDNIDFLDKYSKSIRLFDNRLYNVSDFIVSIVRTLFYMMSSFFILQSLDWWIICLAFVIGIQGFITAFIMNKIKIKYEVEQIQPSRFRKYLFSIFLGANFLKEMKLFNTYKYILKKNETVFSSLLIIYIKNGKSLLRILLPQNVITHIIMLLINIYVIYNIVNGKLTVGDFTLIYGAVVAFGNNLSNFLEQFANLARENIYIEWIDELLNYKSDVCINKEGLILSKNAPINILFKNVSFAYPSTPNVSVIKDLSLKINQGSKIAIVGQNGSGKSTFINLITNLYSIKSGSITYNGLPASSYNTESFHSKFGIVLQDFTIFPISIGENILLRTIENKDDENIVWKALEFCKLDTKVKSLPMGIYTIVSKEFDESGVYFSGGELQKIAIARAYVQDSSILILDEPSSALDSFAEKEIFDCLLKLGNDKTVLYISHRLSTVVEADYIIFFKEGIITEQGAHEDLMLKNGDYCKMFNAQAHKYLI